LHDHVVIIRTVAICSTMRPCWKRSILIPVLVHKMLYQYEFELHYL
jgi:hypothetical protein